MAVQRQRIAPSGPYLDASLAHARMTFAGPPVAVASATDFPIPFDSSFIEPGANNIFGVDVGASSFIALAPGVFQIGMTWGYAAAPAGSQGIEVLAFDAGGTLLPDEGSLPTGGWAAASAPASSAIIFISALAPGWQFRLLTRQDSGAPRSFLRAEALIVQL